MKIINEESDKSAVSFDTDVGDNIIHFQRDYSSILKEIFEPEGRLIVYLSIIGFVGIITIMLYFIFF